MPDVNGAKRKPMTKRRVLVVSGICGLAAGLACIAIGYLADIHDLVSIGLMAAAMGVVWLACARFTSDEPLRPEGRRYLREFFPAVLAYVVILFVVWPMEQHAHNIAARIVIALLPVVPVVFLVRAMVRLVLASDELERRIQLEAISIASLTVGLLAFSAGFLQAAGLLHLEAGLMLVLPALFGVYGLASWWARRRYRGE
jgi:uncharacterized membrane protein HdeD (DUF308 family)